MGRLYPWAAKNIGVLIIVWIGTVGIHHNSCRNRHGPKCQAQARERWLAARERELLATHYFHVAFTFPHEFNLLAQDNPRRFYHIIGFCWLKGT